jgi:hypothetical protein
MRTRPNGQNGQNESARHSDHPQSWLSSRLQSLQVNVMSRGTLSARGPNASWHGSSGP